MCTSDFTHLPLPPYLSLPYFSLIGSHEFIAIFSFLISTPGNFSVKFNQRKLRQLGDVFEDIKGIGYKDGSPINLTLNIK